MAGHNKWSKVKHKKAVTDAKKSREFSKLAQLISVESRKKGGDKESPGLKMAIEKAKQINVPKDVIERAIAKGAGAAAETVEEVVYEAYGPGGAALIIEGVTDNKNRTNAEIKRLLSLHNATPAQPGSALWAFEKGGEGWSAKAKFPLNGDEQNQLRALVEALRTHGDVHAVHTNAAELTEA